MLAPIRTAFVGRPFLALAFLIIAFQAPVSMATAASWPDFQAGLKPGPSSSPVRVTLPEVQIVPPGDEVPPEYRAYSGEWSGWMCRNRTGDTKLAIEKVTPHAATIVYGFASSRVQPYTERLTAYFSGDELSGSLRGGARISFRLRPDGNLDVMWKRSAENWCSGILSK